MILVLCFHLAGRILWYLYAYAPTNILIRHLRSPAGGNWAFPVSAALTVGNLAATAGLTAIIESGGPGWLNLVALTCAWNAIKFVWLTALTLVSVLASSRHHIVRCWRRRPCSERGSDGLGSLIR